MGHKKIKYLTDKNNEPLKAVRLQRPNNNQGSTISGQPMTDKKTNYDD